MNVYLFIHGSEDSSRAGVCVRVPPGSEAAQQKLPAIVITLSVRTNGIFEMSIL